MTNYQHCEFSDEILGEISKEKKQKRKSRKKKEKANKKQQNNKTT